MEADEVKFTHRSTPIKFNTEYMINNLISGQIWTKQIPPKYFDTNFNVVNNIPLTTVQI